MIIVGGGPAGLSAALMLGRCRRRVLVCDAGFPRNARSASLNGYLTRDGIAPVEFLRLARAELSQYGVQYRKVVVSSVTPSADSFVVSLATGERLATRSVLLATGVQDHLPNVEGLADCYGISVHHCPYCDGWETRDKTIAVIGDGVSPVGLALALTTWSDHVVVLANGGRIGPAQRQQLTRLGIAIHQQPVARLLHDDGHLHHVELSDGSTVASDALFFTGRQSQQCGLAQQLGCTFTRKGVVKTDRLGKTCVPGIYVVGDASRDVQFVAVAAAEGAKAAVAINQALQTTDGLVPAMVSS